MDALPIAGDTAAMAPDAFIDICCGTFGTRLSDVHRG